MARKAKSFKLDEKNKTIVLYTNVEEVAAEKAVIELYIKNGYAPKFAKKPEKKTVADMRKELKSSEETLAAFNAAYDEKGGFHKACKIYADWKKAQKTK